MCGRNPSRQEGPDIGCQQKTLNGVITTLANVDLCLVSDRCCVWYRFHMLSLSLLNYDL